MTARTLSPNLALNETVARRRAAGERLVHLGFGEARLPVLPSLAEQLARGATENAYGPVSGGAAVRESVAGYFRRRGLPTEAIQIVTGPGSKALLLALQLVTPGDVVLPRPCWNSYAPQARLAGKQVYGVDIPAEAGGVPDPDGLRETLRRARAAGHDPRTVVLTLPDNPTGTTASPELIRRICDVARDEDLLIVSDEIYRDIVHDPGAPYLSPAEVAPERTVVTSGLSKSFALGGWRVGVARFPSGPLGERLRHDVGTVASETWSALAAPLQTAAAYAFGEPPEVRQRLLAAARLHGAVARAVHAIMIEVGAVCRPPTGGFYLYPDLGAARPALSRLGITGSASLQEHLLTRYGIAVLGGHLLGDDPAALRFKAATSLLYGDTAAQQLAALDAADPAALPHVAESLATIRSAFTDLLG